MRLCLRTRYPYGLGHTDRIAFGNSPSFVQNYCMIETISLKNADMSSGFAICAFMPLSMDFLRSSSKVLADNAMIGIWDRTGSGRRRIVRVAS